MALVSYLPPTREAVPHEPGQWIEFRKPSSKQVLEARRLAEAEGRRGVRDLGVEIVRAFQGGDDDEKAVRRIRRLQAEQEFHADQFDRATLLSASIVGWSYLGDDGRPVPVCPETIADLDEATARWAHQHVIDLMRPAGPEGDKSPADAPVERA